MLAHRRSKAKLILTNQSMRFLINSLMDLQYLFIYPYGYFLLIINRKSRWNLNKATDQLRYHVTMAIDGEEEVNEEHRILTKSTPV
jgi:hypothetical protein